MPRGVPKAGFRMTKNRKNKGMSASNILAMQNVPAEPEVYETDDEIRNKLDERFAALTMMAESAIAGDVRAVVVSGPAGVGKSHEIMEILLRKNPYHTIVRGYVRPTGLYKTLYEYRQPGSVIVFDDSDSIFNDDISLNILKAACDTTKRRMISWLAETRMEDEGGDSVPREFEFEGTVIFITNYDFDLLIDRGNKLAPHFAALVSRSMYLDMAMKNKRDYLIRIKQVVEKGMLREHKCSMVDEREIVSFVEEHQDKLRELSLRMVVKVATLKKTHPTKWKSLARVVCCR